MIARRFAAGLALLLALVGCAVVDPTKKWDNGATLRICFVNPASVSVRQRIARAASEWEKWANLHFDFGPVDDPAMCDRARQYDITIGFRDDGSAALIGTDNRTVVPSMNLGHFDDEKDSHLQDPREFNRIVMHEFGHAIGLEHEFQSPNGNCNDKLDWDKARAYYAQHMGWSRETVDENLKTIDRSWRAPEARMRVSPFDRLSIMQYAMPAEVFTDGAANSCYAERNYELSPTDKQWIAAEYPKPVRAADHRESRENEQKVFASFFKNKAF